MRHTRTFIMKLNQNPEISSECQSAENDLQQARLTSKLSGDPVPAQNACLH